ncbi:GlxA family transcriptional regulator [Corallococcus sp. CA053C]|uniref:GlxA family transcriptional regulator n=1 Tax=Corallococcus sp. CA053C TaxID=2316732 RepID=UPI000EA3B2EA|nr:GlxA family transcriptional regulator [Corallococcus sp. CA053C]RKH13391.1 GlxA family transcriptional regulator [Corallococcus sp. CA053C]
MPTRRPSLQVTRDRPLPARTRRVAMLAYPDVQMLDVTGPLEVFARTSRWLKEKGLREDDAYSVEIIGLKRGAFPASSGLRLHADHRFDEVGRGIDTLLIAGGIGARRYSAHPPLVRWIRQQARGVRRLASICTGAFFLAESGLLEGRRATTHWAYCAEFAQRYPGIQLEPDRIFVQEGGLYTAAGVTAGMDLALALVEEDHGRAVALEVARALVMFLRRPGGQAQFSAQLAVQLAEQEPLRELQAYILEHPREDLSVQALARRVAMSPRNFARVFTREAGMPPARFVTSTRVETARRLLEETSEGLDGVCAKSGLGTPEAMRRAFLHTVGIPPSQYRERFNRPPPATRSSR